MTRKAGCTVSRGNNARVAKGIQGVSSVDILIGIAKGAGSHKAKGRVIDNADLAYIHEKGTDSIPPRPFLSEGVAAQRDLIKEGFHKSAMAALKGDLYQSGLILDQMAQSVSDGVRTYVQSDANFEPIKPESLVARAAQRGTKLASVEAQVKTLMKQGKRERAAEVASGERPLINTGDLIKSVRGFVVKR